MLIGLLHLHRTLAYLLFGVALMNVGLTLSRGRTDPRMAGFVGGITRYGIRMGGGPTGPLPVAFPVAVQNGHLKHTFDL